MTELEFKEMQISINKVDSPHYRIILAGAESGLPLADVGYEEGNPDPSIVSGLVAAARAFTMDMNKQGELESLVTSEKTLFFEGFIKDGNEFMAIIIPKDSSKNCFEIYHRKRLQEALTSFKELKIEHGFESFVTYLNQAFEAELEVIGRLCNMEEMKNDKLILTKSGLEITCGIDPDPSDGLYTQLRELGEVSMRNNVTDQYSTLRVARKDGTEEDRFLHYILKEGYCVITV